MKTTLKTIGICFITYFFSFAQAGKLDSVNLVPNYSVVEKYFSEDIKDTFYVYLKLPKNYKPNEKYPVLYLLDGDITYTMAYSIVRYLQYNNEVPDIIIAAIGYGNLINGSAENMRLRDYSISKLNYDDISGGADKFYDFLTGEIIPALESKYKIDDGNRSIYGHSLSGLFSIYCLMKGTNFFSYYIVSSPYTTDDLDNILSTFSKKHFENFDGKIFISFASEEDSVLYHEPITKIYNTIGNNILNKMNIELCEIDKATHFSAPPISMTKGLQFIYKKN